MKNVSRPFRALPLHVIPGLYAPWDGAVQPNNIDPLFFMNLDALKFAISKNITKISSDAA